MVEEEADEKKECDKILFAASLVSMNNAMPLPNKPVDQTSIKEQEKRWEEGGSSKWARRDKIRY